MTSGGFILYFFGIFDPETLGKMIQFDLRRFWKKDEKKHKKKHQLGNSWMLY